MRKVTLLDLQRYTSMGIRNRRLAEVTLTAQDRVIVLAEA